MQKHPRQYQRIAQALALGVLLGSGASAMAQAWPAKTISIVVPFATGGTTDAIARTLGQELSKNLGQPVIIENKPGAGATIGADYVAKAKPDGYTLLVGAVHHTIATSVYKKLPYDFQRDLAPVSTVAMVPNVLVVNPNLAAKNVAELVALAKKTPGKLSFGSNGNGTGQHLIGAQFSLASGVDIVHVPYKGSGPLTIDLLGGQIDMSFDTVTPVLSHIRAGKLRALAVTTIKRSAALPEVPTLDESGLKGFDQGTWFGLLAPAATPKDVLARLNTEVVSIVKSPEFQKRMEEIGAVPIGGSAAQMAAQIKTDTERYAKLVKDAKVTVQ
ncbi:Bug family tripartite tricarboxylate transporter substrate binding protein [Massilia litorea]|uniref:Tripartite tricarboxylate transporter substrate binding protein n=1 Tax=Massilia litorea TaxID=2769491 RepID=A0A7L9TZK0_9BURK|nr:tripartite tricarboxylate transporter substrate binding protein [Massilia litorea]QOL48213.1 tripartite tricarboxylate transporter substrate binding protein [Massilia litorea]